MIEPVFGAPAFQCPHCSAHAQMKWDVLGINVVGGLAFEATEFQVGRCMACRKGNIWMTHAGPPRNRPMIWPRMRAAPPPHADLPESVVPDYEEAREVAPSSPRAAAALLRLCVQKICIALGLPGKNINDDIGTLVQRGLPMDIQRALDVVRVVGNNAVHPGAMSNDDHEAQVNSLFKLVNMIVQQMITQPREIQAMYEALPAGALKAIEKRDAT